MPCTEVCSNCGKTGLGCGCQGCASRYYYNGKVYCEKCFNEIVKQPNQTQQGNYGIRITNAYVELIDKKSTDGV
jgi:predicted amidophosphoribosyltransferase